MATRTIESKRDRIATILIAPFMTCSARLPVYTMIIAAFLPNRPLLGPLLGTRAVAMLGLYRAGLRDGCDHRAHPEVERTAQQGAPFIMEMPPYRWPMLKSLGLRLLDRCKAFVYRAGTVIMLVSLLLWALPRISPCINGHPPEIQDSVVAKVGHVHRTGDPAAGIQLEDRRGPADARSPRARSSSPRWARLHGMDAESHAMDLQSALHQDLTPAGAVALLVFFAFAMQCMSTMAVVRRETNSWSGHRPVQLHDGAGLSRGLCRLPYHAALLALSSTRPRSFTWSTAFRGRPSSASPRKECLSAPAVVDAESTPQFSGQPQGRRR